MSLAALVTGIVCEIFLWQSGIDVANVTSAAQTMQGIGASGAWWPIDLYNYPDSVRANISELLFSNETLGLTSYRYNIGGGGVNVGNPSRAPETTYVSSTVSNFSADPQGAYFLRGAAQYSVPILTAFVNSAPPSFTSNSQSCGGDLVESDLSAYSEYIVGVVNYWKSQGVDFSYVSPMNEPDNSFGGVNDALCTQEGMAVNATQRAPLVEALRSALDGASLQSVLIQADESSTTFNFAITSGVWLADAASSLGIVSHHDYLFGTDEQMAELGSTARSLSNGKETWFTEICCFIGPNGTSDPSATLFYGAGYDPTMLSALQFGNLLYQSFTQTLDSHFDWWTALSSEIGCDPSSNPDCATSVNTEGWNDGLIYYDSNAVTNGNYALYLTKRYWLLKHFTRAAPIGAVRYEVDSVSSDTRVLAFKTSTSWSILAMNLGSAQELFALSTLNLGSPTSGYQTSADENWATLSLSDTLSCGSIFQMVLPALSVTTIFFTT